MEVLKAFLGFSTEYRCTASVTAECGSLVVQNQLGCDAAQEAAHLLQQAQAAEDALFKAAQESSAQRSQIPQAAIVLLRSPTSITLTHRPFHLKTHAKPAFFAVFAKSFGAGVALGMNSTSMELEGAGVRQPLGSTVTVLGKAVPSCNSAGNA